MVRIWIVIVCVSIWWSPAVAYCDSDTKETAASTHYLRGVQAWEDRDFDMAIKQWKIALRVEPDNSHIKDKLILVLDAKVAQLQKMITSLLADLHRSAIRLQEEKQKKSTTIKITGPRTHQAALAAKTPPLVLFDWTWNVKDGYLKAGGMIKNVTSDPLKNVETVLVCFDESGRFVCTDSNLVDHNPIGAGETVPFSVIMEASDKVATVSVSFREFWGPSLAFRRATK